SGDRIKNDSRDASMLARLYRAGELTGVWVPDEEDEAMRDLVRARQDAITASIKAKQRLKAFLLRHQLTYTGRSRWGSAYSFHFLEAGSRQPAPYLYSRCPPPRKNTGGIQSPSRRASRYNPRRNYFPAPKHFTRGGYSPCPSTSGLDIPDRSRYKRYPPG
ncbi:MAG: transposase, partial [Anaerolineales bacterium]|nr:transposase [Anaerolineales bacterium]